MYSAVLADLDGSNLGGVSTYSRALFSDCLPSLSGGVDVTFNARVRFLPAGGDGSSSTTLCDICSQRFLLAGRH